MRRSISIDTTVDVDPNDVLECMSEQEILEYIGREVLDSHSVQTMCVEIDEAAAVGDLHKIRALTARLFVSTLTNAELDKAEWRKIKEGKHPFLSVLNTVDNPTEKS
jgi:hypothetical protein